MTFEVLMDGECYYQYLPECEAMSTKHNKVGKITDVTVGSASLNNV
jgi:ribosomal 30S subunit maturation factor RimM